MPVCSLHSKMGNLQLWAMIIFLGSPASTASFRLSQHPSAVKFPDHWVSSQIAVGRLGVITEVELSIIPQDMVERLTFETSFAEFVDSMMDLQEDYTEALNGTSPMTVSEVLSDYEGTQVGKYCAFTDNV